MARYKSIIGRYEFLTFSDYLLSDVPAKVDTGAHLSAVHANNIRVEKKGAKEVLKFTLLDNHDSYAFSRDLEFEDFDTTVISNSFGHKEERYIVELKVRVANKVFWAKFTLADRSKKAFPILLGRQLLSRRFLVDSSVSSINKSFLEKKIPKALNEDVEED